MMVSRGEKVIAPLLGFFEVIIWLLAIGQIMQNLSNWVCYLAYGGGFAMGNYIGIRIEERMALGFVMIRFVIHKNIDDILALLQQDGLFATSVKARSSDGDIRLLYCIAERTKAKEVIDTIKIVDAHSFYTISDVRSADLEVKQKDMFLRLMPRFVRLKRLHK
jgi:uncharacterized protein YebE (UPF0316 family)